MLENFPIFYQSMALIISTVIAVIAWRNKQIRGSKEFALSCLASVIWVFGDIFCRFNSTFEGQWISECIRYFGIVLMPVALLIFVMRYCNKNLSTRNIKLLLIVPTISWFVMITNPYHHLFFTTTEVGYPSPMIYEYGLYFLTIHTPYSYLLMFITFITILLEVSRASKHYRTQIITLFISMCIPFLVNVLGIFKLTGKGGYTSLSFPIFFIIMAFAIYRFRFLQNNPIAYETVFQNIRDGVLILDQDDIVQDINPAAAKTINKLPKEVIGSKFIDVFSSWKQFIQSYSEKRDFYDEVEIELGGIKRFLSIRIIPIENADGSLDGRVFTLRDITDRREHQQTLETLAFHDPLTRLANRRKFQEEVGMALEKAMDDKKPFAILYFDLNRFKMINDTLGHEVGDELLKYVAARIASILRKPDILARLGGDEFAALLHDCDEKGIEIAVNRILENVQRPFKVKDHTLVADLSIGASIYPEHGETLDQLLRHADTAMYIAKSGGGGLSIFDVELDSPKNYTM